jgi:hypothetical protein
MQTFAFCYPTLAVSTIYCIWMAYRRALAWREHILRNRVAFLLWTAANQIPDCDLPL